MWNFRSIFHKNCFACLPDGTKMETHKKERSRRGGGKEGAETKLSSVNCPVWVCGYIWTNLYSHTHTDIRITHYACVCADVCALQVSLFNSVNCKMCWNVRLLLSEQEGRELGNQLASTADTFRVLSHWVFPLSTFHFPHSTSPPLLSTPSLACCSASAVSLLAITISNCSRRTPLTR